MKKLLFFGIAALSLFACASQSDKEEPRKDGYTPRLTNRIDSLEKDVMDGHDIGMARIQNVNKYLTQVQQSLDSLAKLPSAKVDKNYQQALIGLKDELAYADMSMFKWMEEYNMDTLENNPAKKAEYLESEKAKVLKVKEAILGSLAKADSLFRK